MMTAAIVETQEVTSNKDSAVAGRINLVSIVGGSMGNFIEWYDFLSYSIFSIYFAGDFFPSNDRTAQLLGAASVAAVGYIVRPLGGWVMGQYADRQGRRAALALSVGLMSIGSLMIAVSPTYRAIGIGAPAFLLLARLIQGLSLGGEYGASAAYLSELAPESSRGFYVSFLQIGTITGQLVALGLLLLLQHAFLRPGQMETWGWRIPFALGAALSIFAIYLRRGIVETKSFRHGASSPGRGTISQMLRFRKEVALCVGMTVGGTVCFYTFTVYVQKLMANSAGFSKEAASLIIAAALLCYLPLQPIMGALSDRIGRRPVILGFGAAGALLSVPLLTGMVHSASPVTAFVYSVASLALLSGYTSIHMLIRAELFPGEVRALGVGLPYAVTTAVLGGTTELVALQLKSIGHETWFFWYVAAACLVSLLTCLVLPETRWNSKIADANSRPVPGSSAEAAACRLH
jgi:MHS family alpha-ketoglutarate permease-like MFS transporter